MVMVSVPVHRVWYDVDAQLAVWERGEDRRAAREVTIQCIKGMETVLRGAGLVILNCCRTPRRVDGEERHGG